MGAVLGALPATLLVGWVFWPIFVIALAVLRSFLSAFVLAATFTGGAMAGFFVTVLIAINLLHMRPEGGDSPLAFVLFVSAGATAGAVVAVFGLSRLTKIPPWRRS